MKKVCVITGGGSGMGFEAAKFMPEEKILVLSGRSVSKLEKAAGELAALGHDVKIKVCDISDRNSVAELADYAASWGNITNVINAAGLSPSMADPQKLICVNALGTVYVNTEFSKRMNCGVILDVSSNAAYSLPGFLASKRIYRLADTDEKRFLRNILTLSSLPRDSYKKAGFAYAFSKNFVVWYAKKCAFEYGHKGIRVLSLSPGLVATDMGNREAGEGAALLKTTAEKRMGTPEELGFAISTAADERNGYLAGVDILCDGGSITGKSYMRHLQF